MDLTGLILIVICVAYAAFVIHLKVNHPEAAARLQDGLRRGQRRYESAMGKAGKAAGNTALKAAVFGARRLLK